jgi:organic radical activating enzyme
MNTASAATGTATGYVTEMFCSVQGEGLCVGERQLFFRTSGCSATCYWCDTVSSKRERSVCLVHGPAKRSVPNPMSSESAIQTALELRDSAGPVGTVSITGGEPLEQAEFVREVATGLRAAGMRIHLETSGLEPKGLLRVRELCDIFAVDIKLPYATGIEHWDTHREFLEALAGRDRFVKVVIDAPTPMAEVERAVQLIADIDRDIPFVLQPESSTYLKNRRGAEARQRLDTMLGNASRHAMRYLSDVRVIPQLHKVMKIR